MRRLLVSMLTASCLVALAPAIAAGQQPAASAPAANETAELAQKLTNSGGFPPAVSWACRFFRRTRILDPRGTSGQPSSFCYPKRSK
jgi:hypothetical protein